MSVLATDVSRERLEFLLHSRWPTDVDEVDGWLRHGPQGLLMDPPDHRLLTPVKFNTHEGQVSSFYWFAQYPDPPALIEALDDLNGLVTAFLGVPAIQDRERGYADFWETPQFAIDMYANEVSKREGQGRRELTPTLQVNVADTALAAAKEAIARANASQRWPLPTDPA
jgi:hypothetical protein